MSEFINNQKNKRYYWLQLKTDFFDQKEIKLLRKIAGGDTYTIIYLKMLLASLKDEGKLYFESIGDNFAEEIALLIDEDPENISITLKYLQSKKLIEIIENDEYFLNRVPEMVGSEAYSTERSRRHRARKKEQELLQCNANETRSNTLQLRDREEIELEIENKKNIDQSPSKEVDSVSLKNKFNEIWEQYPTGRKQGKDKAFKAYKKARKDGVTDNQILKGLDDYKKQIKLQNTELQFIKQGSTWFNNKSWEDEYVTRNVTSNNHPEVTYIPPEWRREYKDVGKMPEPSDDIDLDDLPF